MTNLLTTRQRHITQASVQCTGCGLPNTLINGVCGPCRVAPRGVREVKTSLLRRLLLKVAAWVRGEMMSNYLTEDEIDALHMSDLSHETPYFIRGVSRTPFSIAHYSGGCKFNGKDYVHFPETDELIREDVLKWTVLQRKNSKT